MKFFLFLAEFLFQIVFSEVGMKLGDFRRDMQELNCGCDWSCNSSCYGCDCSCKFWGTNCDGCCSGCDHNCDGCDETCDPTPAPTEDPTPSPTPAPTVTTISCTDQQSCLGDSLSAKNIKCHSTESCRSAEITFKSELYCSGEESCENANIFGSNDGTGSGTGWTSNTHKAYFDGYLAGKNADIKDVTNVFGRGGLSLYQADIDSNDLSVMYLELTGDMTAWNANIFCREGAHCEIKCQGTGCFLTHFYCYECTYEFDCSETYCLFEPTIEEDTGTRKYRRMIDESNENNQNNQINQKIIDMIDIKEYNNNKTIKLEQIKFILSNEFENDVLPTHPRKNNSNINLYLILGLCVIIIFGLIIRNIKLTKELNKNKHQSSLVMENKDSNNLEVHLTSN